ncbi:hypothetical protein K438DRAFT_1953193 [Mycena galopus ATCC 62051]|nr:hypothetical protein K438DRAFT_1953193 [Mycena galopus ATCC 62051]
MSVGLPIAIPQNVFIQYLHQGTLKGNKMVYKLLEEAQMSNYRQYFYIYVGSGWTEELDLHEMWHNDPVEGDKDADWEDTSEDEDEDGEEMPPHFTKSVWKPRSLPPKTLLQPQVNTVQLPYFWAKNMTEFFYGQTPGLFSLMRKIANPGNLLELSDPDIEASFLKHNWKLSYNKLICDWVEPMVSQEYEKRLLKPDPLYFFTATDAQNLLEFNLGCTLGAST